MNRLILVDQRLHRWQILAANLSDDDQFFVTDPVCYDMLLGMGIHSSQIYNPIDVLLALKPSTSNYILKTYAAIEYSVHDYTSYMRWLLANQYLLYLLLGMFLKYHAKVRSLIAFEPLIIPNSRLNSGVPLPIFYAYRRHFLANLAAKPLSLTISTLRLFNIKHLFLHSGRTLLFRICSLTSRLCSWKYCKDTVLLLGTCIPNSISAHFQEEFKCVILKTPRDFSGFRALRKGICVTDSPTPNELRHWTTLLDHLLLPDPLAKESPGLKVLDDFVARSSDTLSSNLYQQILQFIESIYKKYLSRIPYQNAYFSDHVNLDFFAILKISSENHSQQYSLLKHGKQRSSPFAISALSKFPSIRYWSHPNQPFRSESKSPALDHVFASSIPLILVSYASYKPTGFKFDPSHLLSAISFLRGVHMTSASSTPARKIYLVKKRGSEAYSTHFDLSRASDICTLIRYDEIKDHPTALVLAVGQLGTAHIDLYHAGYQVLYFGTCVEQAPISMKSVHLEISSDSTFSCHESSGPARASSHTAWLSV